VIIHRISIGSKLQDILDRYGRKMRSTGKMVRIRGLIMEFLQDEFPRLRASPRTARAVGFYNRAAGTFGERLGFGGWKVVGVAVLASSYVVKSVMHSLGPA
jgi:hypothetical protein